MHLNVIEHNNKQFVVHIYQVNVMLVNHLNQINVMNVIKMQLFLTNMIIYNEEYLVINDIDDDDEHLINDQL
jgi:hypothetical protein